MRRIDMVRSPEAGHQGPTPDVAASPDRGVATTENSGVLAV